MLNGIAPVIIFTFPQKAPETPATGGIPLIVENFFSNVGVPIPIYLDERLTGIYVESETHGIDFDIEADQTSTEEAKARVKGIDSTVAINLLANRNAPLLTALLALSDQIFLKAVSQNFGITYLNGPTLVFNGLLRGFTTSVGIDDDLVRITITISKSLMRSTVPKEKNAQVSADRGALPTLEGLQ